MKTFQKIHKLGRSALLLFYGYASGRYCEDCERELKRHNAKPRHTLCCACEFFRKYPELEETLSINWVRE